jgi:hypothetical protein
MDSLFSSLGIVNADDTIDFETKSVELKDKPANIHNSKHISRKD